MTSVFVLSSSSSAASKFALMRFLRLLILLEAVLPAPEACADFESLFGVIVASATDLDCCSARRFGRSGLSSVTEAASGDDDVWLIEVVDGAAIKAGDSLLFCFKMLG